MLLKCLQTHTSSIPGVHRPQLGHSDQGVFAHGEATSRDIKTQLTVSTLGDCILCTLDSNTGLAVRQETCRALPTRVFASTTHNPSAIGAAKQLPRTRHSGSTSSCNASVDHGILSGNDYTAGSPSHAGHHVSHDLLQQAD